MFGAYASFNWFVFSVIHLDFYLSLKLLKYLIFRHFVEGTKLEIWIRQIKKKTQWNVAVCRVHLTLLQNVHSRNTFSDLLLFQGMKLYICNDCLRLFTVQWLYFTFKLQIGQWHKVSSFRYVCMSWYFETMLCIVKCISYSM